MASEIIKKENLEKVNLRELKPERDPVAIFEKVSFKEWMNSVEDEKLSEENLEIWAALYDDIKLPERATDGSCGYDFFIPYSLSISTVGNHFPIHQTGIRCNIKEGFDLQLVPKSGLGTKYGFHFRDTVGVIDSDYYHSSNEGHIKFCPEVEKDLVLEKGDKMFQGILRRYYLAKENTPTQVRNGGYGSTGK